MKLLIVDDERLARAELRRLLAAHREVELLGEAASAAEVLQLLPSLRPDALLLDVQMPERSGLDLARALPEPLPLVFCTAHANFAVEAFDLNAVDYLLKPIEPARLAEALQRLRQHLARRQTVLDDEQRVLLKRGEQLALVRLGDVARIHSRGNYLELITPQGGYLLLGSLNRLVPRLSAADWLQINRHSLVRVRAIAALEAEPGLGLSLRLMDGSVHAVSRRQAQLLRERFSLL
ncbi:MAG: LytTR family DNA-binding domain-containing protein [Inhella sp.]